MDYFDLATIQGNLSKAFKIQSEIFYNFFYFRLALSNPRKQRIVIALNSIGADVGFVEIESIKVTTPFY
ncbi:MAG: hypothetical protein CM1200mP13_08200 [Candidatus Pelagibacterales bacterium]|nr:MAG: hypothetical protein CM1200mP13_08200 [Pelagibacterales bacterium]